MPSQKEFEKALSGNRHTYIKGFAGSGLSFRFAAAFSKSPKNCLLVFDDAEQAAYYFNDLERLLSPTTVLYFPAGYSRSYAPETLDNANVLLRSEVLRKMADSSKTRIVVAYPEAVFEKTILRQTLKKNTFRIKKGDVLSLDFLNENLLELGFERVNFVSSPGEFAVRGGIVDVFSYSFQHPYRIEFFDDSIERLTSFDAATQLSASILEKIELLPNTSNMFLSAKRKNILDFFPSDSAFVFSNFDKTVDYLEALYSGAEEVFKKQHDASQYPPEAIYASKEELLNSVEGKTVITLNHSEYLKVEKTIAIEQRPQPAFNKQFDLLISHLRENNENNYVNTIFCASEQQAKRLHDIFQESENAVRYETAVQPIFEGFEDAEAQCAYFSDHQIFERYHKHRLKSNTSQKQALTLRELTRLKVNDYVVHIDHGIGKFAGLQRIEVEGNWQEAIKLLYGDRDVLFMSIHSLHKVSKYNGKEGTIPKIHKLGSKAWKTLKEKTKSRVKEIAFDLIQLYAKRRQNIGFAFASDSYLQWELEASFLYEDTPDQGKATDEVKADMESERPMDRLICGDVGFGKTEIAVRAAFKAVDNGKQVAVLVPTTILAFQHFKTFSSRLKRFPVDVDYLNRFRATKDRKRILEEIASGKIDIVIGTHQLVNKNITFKDLGLLIVDEEQKFGVAVKEKLRDLKANVDVLTLTATPIPRTLQFSLMAARDLSIIATPPPNRFPIENEVIRFSEPFICERILYELQRGGQVFFVHNRVENLQEVAETIRRLVPDARITVAHGQTEGKKLEENLLNFMEGRFDILIATTIIENGLDVPNANTIFVNNAHAFGLSDLHQMRGRVGRSNKKAFCYFITPSFSAMNQDAQKRLKAVEQFSALGSGIQIAMKDLEIRGAGDILGGEQSGFINDMGFDMYQKILAEAIDELKENEFKTLYQEVDKQEAKLYVKDVQLDTDFEIYIPDDYVNIVNERLFLYQSLSRVKDLVALEAFERNLTDRFGPLPKQVEELMESVMLKWVAAEFGIERLVVKKGKCIGYFIPDKNSRFYQSLIFNQLIMAVQKSEGKFNLKEKHTAKRLRLLLTIDNVKSVRELLQFFNELRMPTEVSPPVN